MIISEIITINRVTKRSKLSNSLTMLATFLVVFSFLGVFSAATFASDAVMTGLQADQAEKSEDNKAEDKKCDEQPAEEKKAEEAAKEEPKVAETKKDEEPKKEEPKAEEPKKDEPKAEEPKKEEPQAAPAPESVELVFEQLQMRIKLPGVFEANNPAIIRLKADEFNAFELVEVVKQGQFVNEGDVLVKFEPKKYEEALAEKERAFKLSEMSMKEEELNFSTLEAKTPMLYEAMLLAKRYADEDLGYFYRVTEGLNEKLSDFSFKMSEFGVELAREELKQLEKMYASDDLVEETEEIILKRTKMQLQQAENYFERTKLNYERNKEVMKQREEADLKRRTKMEEIDFQKTKELFAHTLEVAKIRLERRRIQQEKEKESLDKMREDKKWLTITAPCSGVVYYGEYKDGKWNGAPMIAASLKVKENVKNDSVLMTIVEPKPTLVRITVPEKELFWVTVGTEGKAAPVAFPDLRFAVKIFEMNEYPGVANEYVALANVNVEGSKVVASMNATVDLLVYDKSTIMVPNSAIKRVDTEDDFETHGYVFVLGDENKTEKVKVRTGKTKGDKTELLEGVSAGQKILKTAEK
ncbi:MAG: hypothetical protein ACRC2T_14240 [Thermoguttaceae bacterium]